MKRSKIFLGITTGVLAFAGLTAAKSHWNKTTKQGFYTNANATACVEGSASCYTTGSAGSSNKCTVLVGVNTHRTLRTGTGNGILCSGNALFTKALD